MSQQHCGKATTPASDGGLVMATKRANVRLSSPITTIQSLQSASYNRPAVLWHMHALGWPADTMQAATPAPRRTMTSQIIFSQ